MTALAAGFDGSGALAGMSPASSSARRFAEPRPVAVGGHAGEDPGEVVGVLGDVVGVDDLGGGGEGSAGQRQVQAAVSRSRTGWLRCWPRRRASAATSSRKVRRG